MPAGNRHGDGALPVFGLDFALVESIAVREKAGENLPRKAARKSGMTVR